jgi:hypothetical protein
VWEREAQLLLDIDWEHWKMLRISALGTAERAAMAALATLATVTFGYSQTTTGTCSPSAVKYIVNNNGNAVSTSTSFTNIDGATLGFTQGGNSPSCVLVLFSGAAASNPSTTMFLRATLDGQTISLPAQIQFFLNVSDPHILYFEARAANFTFPSVTPGTHRIRMQFMSGDGGFVQLTNTTLIVHYAP